MFRLLLLGIATGIVKYGLPILGYEITWLQAIVSVILAQTFALMFVGITPTQDVELTFLMKREDDVD